MVAEARAGGEVGHPDAAPAMALIDPEGVEIRNLVLERLVQPGSGSTNSRTGPWLPSDDLAVPPLR